MKYEKGMKTKSNGKKVNKSAFNIKTLEVGDLVIDEVIDTTTGGSMAYARHAGEKKVITLQNGHISELAEKWPDVVSEKDGVFTWHSNVIKGFSITNSEIKKS